MQSSYHWPAKERVSILTAIVLLSYALRQLLNLPVHQLDLSLGFVRLTFQLNLGTLLSLLAAGLTAAGMDWLLQTHPRWRESDQRFGLEHLLLPTLTALIIGVALNTLPGPLLWWLGFGSGGALMVLVFLSEYIVVDVHDARYPVASVSLTALSFAFYLILASALCSAEARLFLLFPALFLGGGLIVLRILRLRLSGTWEFRGALVIALVSAQFGAALHYWPLRPVPFGLALLGLTYALTEFIAALAEGTAPRQAFLTPLLLLLVFWGLALWFH